MFLDFGCPNDPVVVVDDEGWPIFKGCTKGSRVEANDELPLVTPQSRGRKTLAMNNKSVKKERAREAAAVGSSSADFALHDTAAVGTDMINTLPSTKVCVTKTSEVNKRLEITAHVCVAGKSKRIHVSTFTATRDGPDFLKKGNMLLDFCRRPNASKAKALKYCARL